MTYSKWEIVKPCTKETTGEIKAISATICIDFRVWQMFPGIDNGNHPPQIVWCYLPARFWIDRKSNRTCIRYIRVRVYCIEVVFHIYSLVIDYTFIYLKTLSSIFHCFTNWTSCLWIVLSMNCSVYELCVYELFCL